MNVLIAEDDAMTRLMLQRAVEHDGHTCLVAQDGLKAWQLFKAHRVDVVISDWLMPFLDGVKLCRRVRKQTDRACGYASRHTAQGHALLAATRALARLAFPSGMHAGVPCEVLLWG
jgi:CheY-like chemotaxis protein